MSRLPDDHIAIDQQGLGAQAEHREPVTAEPEQSREASGPGSSTDTPPAFSGTDPAKKRYQPLNEDEVIDSMDEEQEDYVAPKKKSKFKVILERIVPPGGILSSSFTLGSSTLGAGILGLPSAFSNMGLASALIIMMVVAVLTVFSLWLLARCGDIAGKRTFEDVVRVIFGRGPDYGIAVFMIGFCVGGAVSYIISIGDLLTPILDYEDVSPPLRSKWFNRAMTTLIWLVCILPLCLPKHIDSLRHTSVIGVTMVVFFVICIVEDCGSYLSKNGWRSDVKPFGTGNSAIQGLGTIIFAYLVQINAYEVRNDMKNATPGRMVIASIIAISGCSLLYICAGLFGYARFGSEVKGSILLMYQPRQEPQFWVAYFGIVVKICLAFALHQLPLRDAIYHFFSIDVVPMAWWKNAVFCAALAFVILVAGLFIPDIDVVLGLVGSLCGGFIGFIYPSLMIMYCGNWTLKRVGFIEWASTYFLLLVGVVAVVFGTAASIYGVVPDN